MGSPFLDIITYSPTVFSCHLSDMLQLLLLCANFQEPFAVKRVQPTQPSQPSQPLQSTQPLQCTQSTQPTQSAQLTQPLQPLQCTQCTQRTQSSQPTQSAQLTQPLQSTRLASAALAASADSKYSSEQRFPLLSSCQMVIVLILPLRAPACPPARQRCCHRTGTC